MKTEKILRAAKARIADKKNWLKYYLFGARKEDVLGERIVPVTILAEANCFCSVGALAAAVGIPKIGMFSLDGLVFSAEQGGQDWVKLTKGADFERAHKYLQAAAKTVWLKHGGSLAGRGTIQVLPWEVNDCLGHEAAMDMFTIAIRRARRRHVNGG